MRRILLYLFTFIVVQLVVSYAVFLTWLLTVEGCSLAQAVHGMLSDPPFSVTLHLITSFLFTFILLYIYIGREWCPRSTFVNSRLPRTCYLYVGIAVLASLLPSIALQELFPALPNIAESELRSLLSTPLGYIVICLFAPILEEVVFRGAVLRVLLRIMKGVTLPVVISAALFALLHFNPAQMLHAFLIGLLMAYFYLRTRSLLPCILFHWVNNTAVFVYTLSYPETVEMSLIEMFNQSYPKLIFAVVLSLAVLVCMIVVLHRQTMRLQEGQVANG